MQYQLPIMITLSIVVLTVGRTVSLKIITGKMKPLEKLLSSNMKINWRGFPLFFHVYIDGYYKNEKIKLFCNSSFELIYTYAYLSIKSKYLPKEPIFVLKHKKIGDNIILTNNELRYYLNTTIWALVFKSLEQTEKEYIEALDKLLIAFADF